MFIHEVSNTARMGKYLRDRFVSAVNKCQG